MFVTLNLLIFPLRMRACVRRVVICGLKLWDLLNYSNLGKFGAWTGRYAPRNAFSASWTTPRCRGLASRPYVLPRIDVGIKKARSSPSGELKICHLTHLISIWFFRDVIALADPVDIMKERDNSNSISRTIALSRLRDYYGKYFIMIIFFYSYMQARSPI